MSTKVQVRRGTDADRGTMVLASGELGWTTDTKKLYVGDGATYGGIDIADAEKTTSGTFGVGRVPILPTDRYGSAVLVDGSRAMTGDLVIGNYTGPARVLSLRATNNGTASIKFREANDNYGFTLEYMPTPNEFHIKRHQNDAGGVNVLSFERENNTVQLHGSLDMNSHIIKNLTDPTAAQHAASKNYVDVHNWGAGDITSGTLGLARIPTMDDAHIPNLEGLSYGAAFATTQIPNLPTSKITSGTLNTNRIPVLPTNRYGSAVLLSGDQTIGGTKTFGDIPILPASDPTSDNEAARKSYVDAQGGGGGAGTLCELSDVDCAGTVDGYVLTYEASSGTWKPAASGGAAAAASEGTYSSSFTFGSAQAIQDAGTAFTIGGFMTHGYIKEVDFRANYTCGTLTTVSAKVNNASGILPAGTVIANDGRVGTFLIGDYIESANEIMRISGTVSPGTLYVSRGKKGSGAGFIDDNEDLVRLNSGFTMQLFKNSNKKKHEMPLQLSSLMCAKGVTDASMSSGGKRIQLSADLKNVDALDTVRIDDGASSEEALVQNNVGDCVAGTYDYNLYVYDTLGSHASSKTVEKVCKYDIPSNYKSTAGTLYGRLHLMENLGSNLNININIKGDKF